MNVRVVNNEIVIGNWVFSLTLKKPHHVWIFIKIRSFIYQASLSRHHSKLKAPSTNPLNPIQRARKRGKGIEPRARSLSNPSFIASFHSISFPLLSSFLSVYVGMVSIFTLSSLAIQRWLLVTRPGKFSPNNWTHTRLNLALIWSLSLAVALPPLLGWSFYAPETSGLRYGCDHQFILQGCFCNTKSGIIAVALLLGRTLVPSTSIGTCSPLGSFCPLQPWFTPPEALFWISTWWVNLLPQ